MQERRTAAGRAFVPGEGATRDALVAIGLAFARRRRQQLTRTTFIGVTGSGGKTTTKDLIAAILSTELRGTKSPANRNHPSALGKTILRTRRRDDFCVTEIATGLPGTVADLARLVRPSIAVVTAIGTDHFKVFRTLEETAAEKRALVDALPPNGILVTNVDDPHAAAMAQGFAGCVILVGTSAEATLRAEDVRSAWPDSLSFTLHHDGAVLPVRTRLNGRHWTAAVLAALGVAVAMGVSMERALEVVAAFEPVPGRMSRADVNGVGFVRDDAKAPLWSLDRVLEYLQEARAERKILILGTVSDYPGARSRMYARVTAKALEVADLVAVVGIGAHSTRLPEPVVRFATVREAAEYFRDQLREGDLVLVKGSNRADHLLRIVLAQTTDVRCWRVSCGLRAYCDACRLLHVSGGPEPSQLGGALPTRRTEGAR